MAMTREQMNKLIELIDAKIAEAAARYSSDGGLSEYIRVMDLEKELRELCPSEED